MKAPTDKGFPGMLRSSGLKATPARLALLKALAGSAKPLAGAEISGRLAGLADQATVYRALDALERAGIVKKVDFHDSRAYYEMLAGGAHHHHVVCEVCGAVEDVAMCDVEGLEASALRQCKKFESIRDHSLEFFGVCSKCSRA